jgi:hypothetical protein
MTKDQKHPKRMDKTEAYLVVLLTLAMLLSGCNLGSNLGASTQSPDTPPQSSDADQPQTFLPVIVGAEPGAAGEALQDSLPQDTPDPAAIQASLKDEWRPVIQGASLLFASCEMMFDTYMDFQIEETNLAEAQAQLAVEAELIASVNSGIAAWSAPAPAAQPYLEQVVAYISKLNDLLARKEAGDIGSFENTDLILDTCLSLFDLQDTIASAAVDAGIDEASMAELESENSAIIEDFKKRLGDGN